MKHFFFVVAIEGRTKERTTEIIGMWGNFWPLDFGYLLGNMFFKHRRNNNISTCHLHPVILQGSFYKWDQFLRKIKVDANVR